MNVKSLITYGNEKGNQIQSRLSGYVAVVR